MGTEKSSNTLNLPHEFRKETSISSINALSSSTNQNTASNGSSCGQEDSLIPKLIPVDFIWKGNCDLVYITGSFCNWKQNFLMQQTTAGMFILTLKLQEGIYQYKYIINNDWQYSPNQPTINLNGVTNNVIEVKDNQTLDRQPILKEPHFSKRDGYETIKDVHIEIAPAKCNDLYNQNIDMTNKSISMNINYYAQTEPIGHIHLNHLLINNHNNCSNKRIIKAGYIRRIRSKFVTIVYISSKEK